MEELISEGKIQGVFDLSTNEVLDHLYGGMTDAGPKRLEMAGAIGLPYLVAPGNLDHLLFASRERIPERFRAGRFILMARPSFFCGAENRRWKRWEKSWRKNSIELRAPPGLFSRSGVFHRQ